MTKSERRKYIAELEGAVGRAAMLHVRTMRRIDRLEAELRAANQQCNVADYKMAQAVERAEHAERRLTTVEGYAATFEKDHARIVKEWSDRCDLRDVRIGDQATEIQQLLEQVSELKEQVAGLRREAHVRSSD